MTVFLLSPDDIEAIQQCNKVGATIVICDHGKGPCVNTDILMEAAFSQHKEALSKLKALALRTTYTIHFTDI